jgi:di/tricarboxylate transporter
MSETTAIMVGAAVAGALWLAWALFSDTRRNHGFWVAFLLPLAPVIFPLLWLIYIVIKYPSYLAFVALGRREEHEEFMREVRRRSGVFLLF